MSLLTRPETFRLPRFRFVACFALLLATLAARSESASIVPAAVPGASSIAVSGLNQSGHLAGIAYDANPGQRAFLWTNGVAWDLGAFGGSVSAANALNNSDQVVGYAATANDAEFHAFVFRNGSLTDLGNLGGSISSATAVNDAGQIAGYALLADGMTTHAFLFSGGAMGDLGTLGGSSSSAVAINSVAQVVGDSTVAGDAETHAFLYSAGVLHDLGTLGGTFSRATAINTGGLTTGYGTTTGDLETHAFVHNGLQMQDLSTLGGLYSYAYAINDSGQVAGDSTLSGDAESHAFIFSGGVMQDLGTLGGGFSTPWAINNLGQVVGISSSPAGVRHAFLWQNGVMTDLNSLLPLGSGWDLGAAYFVNDASQIVGTGTFQGQPSWFLLTVQAGANQPPLANAGPDQTVECTGETTAVILDGSASSDPDGDALTFEWFVAGRSLGTSPKLGLGLSLGSYTFVLRVTDGRGATADDDVVIDVVDTTSPVIQCPKSLSASADGYGGAVVPNFLSDLVVSDNGTPMPALHITQSPTNGTVVSCGATAVTITVTDAAGNQSVCTTTFTVVDLTPPVVCCPKEITRNAHMNCQAAVPNLLERIPARDNCTPADQLVKTQSPAPGTLLGLGDHEIKVSVADAAGNVTTCVVLFNVVDRTPPRLRDLQANPAFLRDGSREMIPITLSVVASDNCDPHPVCRIVSVTSSDPATGNGDVTTPDWKVTGDLTVQLRAERSAPDRLRVYTIKVACSDASGNTSTRSLSIPIRPAPRGNAR